MGCSLELGTTEGHWIEIKSVAVLFVTTLLYVNSSDHG